MNWEAIGAIGEIVGAIGVIATLGYLAAQIRQSSNVVRSSTRQAISSTQMELSIKVAGNPDLRASVTRIGSGETAPTPDDEICDLLVFRAVMRSYENQYHQHEDGTFDDEVWSGYLENIRQSFAQPGYTEPWKAHRARYSARFASFVEREILAGPGDGSDA